MGALLTFPASPYARRIRRIFQENKEAVVIVEMMVLPQSNPFPDTSVFKVFLGHRKHPFPDGLEGLNWIKSHHRLLVLGSNSRISTEIPSTPFRYQSHQIYPDFLNVPRSHISSVSTSSGLQVTQLQLCPERDCSLFLMSPASLLPRAPGDQVWFPVHPAQHKRSREGREKMDDIWRDGSEL